MSRWDDGTRKIQERARIAGVKRLEREAEQLAEAAREAAEGQGFLWNEVARELAQRAKTARAKATTAKRAIARVVRLFNEP